MKNSRLLLLLITWIFTGCLSESSSDQTNQPIETESDTSAQVQPPIFFPVKDSGDDNIDNGESDDIDNISDDDLTEQDEDNFPELEASNINFSGNITTIPLNITNPIFEDVYVNIYRNYSTDDDGNYIVNHDDRVMATAITEANYEGSLFLTPDINKLLIEIISLNDNQIITQKAITFPIERINL
ncbi:MULTISPECIES: hypothetical protein [unclassified Photobacterium]|uniref:hypothetical protein n=1 Tax=unclassified Photobacterium TaxID=2628852 RepID=UPI000D176032|nr:MULTISPECIES: hypothetical protein [unclassified Photobacterium]PSV26296.1 hypothetical protein C9J42_11315 [Photobacterium sp. GB-56]PSV28010.1 hypothetical protein C9J40_19815 [Photobacterium sp. GB-72]PSV31573.1 hypothetical protein C9J44_19745 [Photobacterium sp. GB-27]PSV38181.1 hypothetical protein C9J46_20855 [Photobacterium sp. GB-36]PSV51018.1 hypothetical protein C9J45_17655 [Photobacterium sp. GB-1]